MLDKISVAGRLLAIIVAVVAGVVTIPNVDVNLVLIVLGLIAGLSVKNEHFTMFMVAVVALPVIATVLTGIPSIGTQLGAIFSNFGVAVAASMAMAFALGTIQNAKADGSSLMGGGGS